MSGKSLETLVIREATFKDVEALCLLEKNIFSSNQFKRNQFLWLLSHANAYCIVVENALGELVGYGINLYRKKSKVCRVYGFGLAERARGNGTAAEMMQKLYQHALMSGCTKISLEVRRDNAAAARFYLKEGFFLHQHLPSYYEDGMDGVRMRKVITE